MKVFGVFLHLPYPTADSPPGEKQRTEFVFGRTREEADRLAYEKWVLPYTKEGEWIYENHGGDETPEWAKSILERAKEGKYQEVLNEAWDGYNGDWLHFFEGEMPKPQSCKHGFSFGECCETPPT